jgi:hypothetical protein
MISFQINISQKNLSKKYSEKNEDVQLNAKRHKILLPF